MFGLLLHFWHSLVLPQSTWEKVCVLLTVLTDHYHKVVGNNAHSMNTTIVFREYCYVHVHVQCISTWLMNTWIVVCYTEYLLPVAVCNSSMCMRTHIPSASWCWSICGYWHTVILPGGIGGVLLHFAYMYSSNFRKNTLSNEPCMMVGGIFGSREFCSTSFPLIVIPGFYLAVVRQNMYCTSPTQCRLHKAVSYLYPPTHC